MLFLSCSLSSQNDQNKWTVGVSLSTVMFGDEASKKVKENFNMQFPSIEISRKLGQNLSVDFIYTVEFLQSRKGVNAFKYSSFDTYLRYELPELFLNIVPFGGIGFGYIKGATTTPNPQGSLSLNIMGGATIWVSERVGLTGRIMYKNVSSSSESMASHFQAIGGIVYNFNIIRLQEERGASEFGTRNINSHSRLKTSLELFAYFYYRYNYLFVNRFQYWNSK